MDEQAPAIQMQGVATRFGSHVVHEDLDLEIGRAEIFAIIGGSGSGKSTLLREMILLHTPDAGSVKVLGTELRGISDADAQALRRRWGVLFQHGGLFGSLTVAENVALPLQEHTDLDPKLIADVAAFKLRLAGLAPEVGALYPSELSGGMLKRASLARSLALDPELLFLDEPTAGLDPVAAAGVDELVLKLRELFGLTIIIITHDLDLLWQVADRVAVLGKGKVQAVGSMAELSASDNPAVRPYFEGARGRSVQQQAEGHDGPVGDDGHGAGPRPAGRAPDAATTGTRPAERGQPVADPSHPPAESEKPPSKPR